jgi:peroxiredoxin
MGERTARYAMIIDHGKVVHAEKEPGKDVTVSIDEKDTLSYNADNLSQVSSADSVLAKL